MCGPIPEGRWAWHFDKCIDCETTEVRHKGRGLCLRCWDKDRDRSAHRKAIKKKARDKYYEKHKNDSDYMSLAVERAKQWQADPKSGYRALLQRRYRKERFKRLAENIICNKGRELKKYGGG